MFASLSLSSLLLLLLLLLVLVLVLALELLLGESGSCCGKAGEKGSTASVTTSSSSSKPQTSASVSFVSPFSFLGERLREEDGTGAWGTTEVRGEEEEGEEEEEGCFGPRGGEALWL